MTSGIDPRLLAVLLKICARLHQSDVNWAVTGSLSLALQGRPVEVHDIDLHTDEAGAYEIQRRFAEFVTREVRFCATKNTEKIRSHFGTLTLNGIEVEIIGDVETQCDDGHWEKVPQFDSHKRAVEVQGMQIPVLSLEYEYEVYRKLGRVTRMEMIHEWLEGKGQRLKRIVGSEHDIRSS